MLELFKRYRELVLLLALLTIPILVYRAQVVEPSEASVVDRTFVAVTAPVQLYLSHATESVSAAWYGYFALAGAQQANVTLRRELALAHRDQDRLATMALENERLQGLLGLREQLAGDALMPARIIAVGASALLRSVRVDRGTADGVRRGMAVVATAGIVGRIARTYWHAADVALIADEKASLDVVVQRSRARGRVRGVGTKDRFVLALEYVPRTDDVRAGDRVVSSGLGGVYPRDLAVGTVTRVEAPATGLYRLIEVAPAVDFSRLEEVMIVAASPPSEAVLETPAASLPASLRAVTTGD